MEHATRQPRKFDVPPDAAVVTTTYVTRGGMPILDVTHERDEEDGEISWQFHCGNGDYDPAVLQLVRLDEILARDRAIADLADLPIGFCAKRADVDASWTFQPARPS